MEYQIKQLSCFAERLLRRLSTGTVHSVYRRTVNLTGNSAMLSLQAAASPVSPISLISDLSADGLNALSLNPGDRVRFGPDFFDIRKSTCAFRFSFADARRYDLKLSGSLDRRSLSTLSSRVRSALSLAETGGFSLLFQEGKENGTELSLTLLAAKKHILLGSQLCLAGKYPEAAEELSRLIGLGTGLTPSGDDFLCGVLAGICLSGKKDHPVSRCLRERISARLSDTIDISAAFLSCALSDQFSLPVNSLRQTPSPEEILASFGEIGHSSGTDTLCGILWSLEHV